MEENEQEKPSEGNDEGNDKDSEGMNKNSMMIIGVIVIIVLAAGALFLNNQNKSDQSSTTSEKSEEVIKKEGVDVIDKEDGDAMEKDSSVEVSDQTAGDSVTVDSAYFLASGYIVIHEEADGELGPVIGNSVLYENGTFENITVTLDRTSVEGETLYAMLHDDNGDGEYEFPGADAPTQNQEGEVVVLPFEVL